MLSDVGGREEGVAVGRAALVSAVRLRGYAFLYSMIWSLQNTKTVGASGGRNRLENSRVVAPSIDH